MPNPSTEERLKSLSRKEARVLYWKCKGLNHVIIANKLVYGSDRVTQLMSVVYQKLGFRKTMHWTERARLLSQVFCGEFMALIGNDYGNLEEWPLYGVPLAGEIVRVGQDAPEGSTAKVSAKSAEEPVPDPEMMAMVLEDEKRVPVGPKVVQGEIVGEEAKGNGNGSGHGQDEGTCLSKAVRGLGVLALIAAVGGAAYYFGVRRAQSQAPLPVAFPSPSAQGSVTLAPSAFAGAAAATFTPAPQPSSTPLPTSTPYPTNTPKPSIPLPFADDFSNGINPRWYVYSGKWLTTGTGATITIGNNDPVTGALVLDDPTLTNYRLSVKVHSPGVLSACQGDLGVVVRYQADRDQNLMYFMNSASRFYWGYTDSLSPSFGSVTQITDVVKANIISDFVMELEASGNNFTARIDGAKYDSFSLTGYESGGVALVPVCGCVGYCPSFSSFSLEPLP